MGHDQNKLAERASGMAEAMPNWVPRSVQNYLGHTEMGIPIRVLARDQGCHASTILRQIRRVETLRDDPLVDGMLKTLGWGADQRPSSLSRLKETGQVKSVRKLRDDVPDATTLGAEGLRVLRRLCERGAVLAVAAEMEKAVIVRDGTQGQHTRTAVVDRAIAEAMALKGWIATDAPARITRYSITASGRAALEGMAAEQIDTDETPESPDGRPPSQGRVRYSLAESPLSALARRRDRDGNPFLSDPLVRAGERLREDFEMAQLGPRLAKVWTTFVQTQDPAIIPDPPDAATAQGRAQAAVMVALQELGPGLSDVALRCCCYLEGLEAAEKKLGWSARSGKIVLRIGLMRLRRHYDSTLGKESALIG